MDFALEAKSLDEIDDVSENTKDIITKAAAYAAAPTNDLFDEIVRTVGRSSLDDVKFTARIFSEFLAQISIAERHHRYRRWSMYKRGESEILHFSDGQNHQADDCFKNLIHNKGFTPSQIHEALCKQNLELVFTAHPTEARSPESLFLFQKITHILEQALQFDTSGVEESLSYLLRLALKVPMSREQKPTVKDEAEYLYSIVLREEIIDQQITFSQQGVPVNFRSWVGGDKDGHPNVDEKTLITSLEISRKHLLQWLRRKLELALEDLSQLGIQSTTTQNLLTKMDTLSIITKGDGSRIEAFKSTLHALLDDLELKAGLPIPPLDDIREMLIVYPALVLALEVREDSELVREAADFGASNSNEALDGFAIARMIHTLRNISEGSNPKWYVRCLVLSMVMDEHDVQAGYKLICQQLGEYRIPVVPLFENAHALQNGTQILEGFFKLNKGRKTISIIEKAHHELWESRFEVMLGYSDSSKESGVLPSRYLIQLALQDLEKFFKRHKLTPIYFHGSGGSIERGGGSIKEQTQGWPKSAVNIFKATVQGEMVARNFGSALIMRSQIEKIIDQLAATNTTIRTNPISVLTGKNSKNSILHTFSKQIQTSYQKMVQKDEFFEHILQATPYNYLDVLRIGSRPSKRQTASRKLRAIPWVLCWTQTRVLFPTWWGVGSAYEALSVKDRSKLRKELKINAFLTSYVKALGFTLRKVELPIWRLYLERLDLPKAQIEAYYQQFAQEFNRTLTFFHEMTGQEDLLWHRPWLGESIYFRSSMIHPLNLIQLEALKRSNESLLRETVTGVACGMMTTG